MNLDVFSKTSYEFLKIILWVAVSLRKGATPFSITTLSIATFSIRTLSIATFSITFK
jgi:hypothetical protein